MKNNRILSFFVYLSISFVLSSFLLFGIFLYQNNLSWSDYWQKSNFYSNISIPKLKFTKGIKTLHQELTFPLKNKLSITVDIEGVSFIEENREDILVVYHYRHPNSPEYIIDFKAFSAEDEIQIIATTQAKTKNSLPFSPANLDGIYRGSVEIHVPINFQLDTLTLTTSVLSIHQDMLYENTNNYILMSSMGNVDFIISKPKHNISIDTDLGNISIQAQAEVDTFDLISNLGNAYLNFQKPMRSLYIINSFGLNNVILEDQLKDGYIQNNVGNILLFCQKVPTSLNVSTLTGDITGYIGKNPSTYLHSEEGNISSFFDIQDNSKNQTLFYFTTHSGNIKLMPPTPDSLTMLKKDALFSKIQRKSATSKEIPSQSYFESTNNLEDDDLKTNDSEESIIYPDTIIPASGIVSGSSITIHY